VGYVNAHGTGTVQNDRAEAIALRKVFGPEGVLVSATKSLVGHGMAAAGAVEAVATILALASGVVPPTANLREPDPDIPFDCVPGVARPAPLEWAMSNSFGFGGQNLSLVFQVVPGGRRPRRDLAPPPEFPPVADRTAFPRLGGGRVD
jgi:3-oxoacyl-[acyl-carrier-protein] synthase II